MFSFLIGKQVAFTTGLIFLLSMSVYSQKPYLSLSELNDSADRYWPRLMEKKAQLNSASVAVTETRHQFLPAFRFNDQVNLGSDNSIAGSYFPYGIVPSTSSGVTFSS